MLSKQQEWRPAQQQYRPGGCCYPSASPALCNPPPTPGSCYPSTHAALRYPSPSGRESLNLWEDRIPVTHSTPWLDSRLAVDVTVRSNSMPPTRVRVKPGQDAKSHVATARSRSFRRHPFSSNNQRHASKSTVGSLRKKWRGHQPQEAYESGMWSGRAGHAVLLLSMLSTAFACLALGAAAGVCLTARRS